MNAVSKLVKQLNKQHRIARLPTELINTYKVGEQDADTLLILMSAQARDPHAVQRLMQRYNVTSAAELIPLLPKRKRPNWKKRLLNWLRRLEGSYAADPIHREFLAERQIRTMRGYHETRINPRRF